MAALVKELEDEIRALEDKLRDYDALRDRLADLEDKLAALQLVLGDRDPHDLERELQDMK